MIISTSKLRAGLLAGAFGLSAAITQAEENVMVVFDGSNSMWGQIDGVAKIEIARSVMDNLLGDWTEDRAVGLMAYGHRRRGDCTDIETLVEPGMAARPDILARINAITPTGKTPLTAAVEEAATALSYTDQPATVVLISDGLESCDRDPCALAAELEQRGVKFTAHVVGFGLGGDEDTASLACIAEETGGQFIEAGNADELGDALSTLGTAVAEAPEPEPQPELPDVTLSAPASAETGSQFKVAWAPYVKNDIIQMRPVGAPEDTTGFTASTGDTSEMMLTAPGDEGLYDIRYLDRDTRTVLGSTQIEIVRPAIVLTGPDRVVTGENFDVSWDRYVSKNDYVTIVPLGAEEGELGNYGTVGEKGERRLRAPADTGLYELRYVLRQDRKTMGSRPIEVAEPEVTVSAPATIRTGETFKVSYTGTVTKDDYVTIVAVGTEEGKLGNYGTVGTKGERMLRAPSDTGLYEVRYVLREGSRTLATAPVEVTGATIELTGPENVVTGADFKVSWSETVSKDDYITIVPVGSEEGTVETYKTVGEKGERTLRAPSEPGLYELRYVLREGKRTLATAPVEVTDATVTISGPAQAVTGAQIKITWSEAITKDDYVTVVPMGADEGTFGAYQTVGTKGERTLRMPADTGMYELRYVLRKGSKTLASQPIEIVAPEVTISGPASTPAGSDVRITWTGMVSKDDYITIVPMGSDEGTYGPYTTTGDKEHADLMMPGEPGLYELRYVLREGARTMATQPIEATQTEVTLAAPEQVRVGEKIRVSWTGTVNGDDYLNLVPLGAEDSAFGSYFTVGDQTERDIKGQDTPGLYELRYILRANNAVLARVTVEVLAADAALNTGASLTAPATASAGSKISVGWETQVQSADQRITLAKADQPIFTWLEAVKTDTTNAVEITLPSEPGVYELRFLDVTNQEVRARQVITVE